MAIREFANTRLFGAAAPKVLLDIVETTISPELVPQSKTGVMQGTEASIGPYELHDFSIYYLTRFGLRPSKIAFLALHARHDARSGTWPPGFPKQQRRTYDLEAIRRWLEEFLLRFFANQFKRSALPNAPKVTTGGSVAPRRLAGLPPTPVPGPWLRELCTSVPERLAEEVLAPTGAAAAKPPIKSPPLVR